MESALGLFIITTVGAGAAFLVKFYFSSLEDRINKIEKDNEARNSAMTLKIDSLNEAYGKIFNEILTKFSNWEDRIKNIMDSLVKDRITQPNTTKETMELTEHAFSGFDSITKRQIMNIKKEVENLDRNIKSVERTVQVEGIANTAGITNMLRESLAQINNDVRNIQNKNILSHDDLRDKIIILHTVCKSINADCRRIDEKVRQLQEDTKQKIVLKY